MTNVLEKYGFIDLPKSLISGGKGGWPNKPQCGSVFVYMFVCENKVIYVADTKRALKERMTNYKNHDPSQKTNKRVMDYTSAHNDPIRIFYKEITKWNEGYLTEKLLV